MSSGVWGRGLRAGGVLLGGLGFASLAWSQSAKSATPADGAAPVNGTKREQLYTGNPPKPATPPPETIEQIKKPVDWFSWGADFRWRHEYLSNAFLVDRDPPGYQWNNDRYRARLWSTIAPLPALDFNVRLGWEGRSWWDPPSKGHWDGSEVFWDNLNAKVKISQGDVPATLTVGRQDLRFGDGWLIFEGTPLDGSRSIYFDAARLNLDFKHAKTTADLVFIQQESDSDAWLRPFGSEGKAQIEQDERGAIAYLSNTSLPRTQLDGYFIYKHDEKVLGNGDSGDIYTLGTRAVHDLSEHWQLKGEAAYQFGQRHNTVLFPNSDGDLSAFGINTRLTYRFKDSWNNQVYAGYEYLSGDDPSTKGNEQFDPLWGRWPQYSELYVYTMASETRIAEISNLHRLNVGWSVDPTRQLSLCANYHALFADENTYAGRAGFSSGGSFRGHLFTAIAKYKFNRYLSGHVVGEYFLPGNYYQEAAGALHSREDGAAFVRAELVFTF